MYNDLKYAIHGLSRLEQRIPIEQLPEPHRRIVWEAYNHGRRVDEILDNHLRRRWKQKEKNGESNTYRFMKFYLNWVFVFDVSYEPPVFITVYENTDRRYMTFKGDELDIPGIKMPTLMPKARYY